MKNIDQQLITIKYKMQRKAYLQSELKQIKEKLERNLQTKQRLEQALNKEVEDVERLEHISFSRLLTGLSGQSHLSIEKEKAEAFRAALDYRLKSHDVEYLSMQKNLLEQELKQYETLEQDVQGLMEIKRKSLHGNVLDTIKHWESEVQLQKDRLKQLQEMIDNGKKLCSSFTYVMDNLSELVEDKVEAKSFWYPIITQEQMDDVFHEIDKMNHHWEQFEQLMTLTKAKDDVIIQKLKQSMANIRGDDDSSQMRLSFEHLNEAYATVREILCELKKKRKEIQYRIRDLEWKITEKIETSE